jgi:hypothetical protein
VGIGAAVIAVIAVLFLKEVPLRSSWDEEGPPPAALG